MDLHRSQYSVQKSGEKSEFFAESFFQYLREKDASAAAHIHKNIGETKCIFENLGEE